MDTLNSIRQTLFTQWNLVRWIRLIAGVFLLFQAIQLHDSIAGFISILLLFQAITNTGCCGVDGCSVPVSKNAEPSTHEVEYEEIKGNKK
jgi:hypothetical protein